MSAAHGTSLRPVEETDAVLAERAAGGDDRAFGVLYQRHARYVAGVAYRLLGADAEVDDVVQETFLAALEHLPALRDTGAVRPWLARIAARRVLHRFSARSRLRSLLASLTHTSATRSEPQLRQAMGELERALSALRPELRIPWVLHEVEGETLPEVARLVGVSLATVKRRIAEAERALGALGEVGHVG
jgi:RNA polymerase sigma-70 factor (ECF subfamily)